MSRIATIVACFIFLVGALFLPSLVLAGSATVTWQPNTEADLAKYRVYWSTTAGVYGSYKAEVPKGTTTYTTNSLTDGQTYYFVLTAVDLSGNESGFSSPSSKTISGGTAGIPPAPVLSAPASGANVAGTSVTFTWQAAQGATDYNLKLYNPSGSLGVDRWVGNVLTYTVGGFANQGQSYTWTVTARNASGQGPSAAQRSFVNGTSSTSSGSAVLLTPANGATVSGTSITFTWQKAPASTYNRIRVYKSDGSVFYDRWVSSSVSHTVSGFSNNGATYSWEIYPYNSTGLLPISPRWTFVNGASETPSAVPPAPVLSTPASGANLAGTSVTFTWQAAQGATDYNLKLYNPSGSLGVDRWLGNVLTYTVGGFGNQGQSYTWTITARNAAGQGPSAAQRSFVNGTSSTPSGSAVLLTPANGATVSGTSITFTWQKAPASTYNRIRVYNSDGSVFYDRWVSSSVSQTVSGFSNNGATYSWEIYPYNSTGLLPISARSSFVNGTSSTPTAAPPAPALSAPAGDANVAGTSVTFTWQAAQGATDYNLKLYNSSGTLAFDRWLGNVLTYTVGGFGNQGQSYTWTVTARNASGQGPAAAQRSFVNGTGSSTPSGSAVLLTPANGATVSGTSITFTWQKAPASTYNRIRVYKSDGSVFYDRWVSSSVSQTVSGFSNNGATYSWEIYPYNSTGLLPISARWNFVNG